MTLSPPEATRAVAGAGAARNPGLRLADVRHREFGPGDTVLTGPVERAFFPAFTRRTGVPLREDIMENATGNTYAHMGGELLTDGGTTPPGEVDLLVLAYSTPDLLPSRMAGPALSDLFPGGPLVLAVSEQGRTAPFTALRLAQSHAHRHGPTRALVMVFDQDVMPYDIPRTGPHRVSGDAAVALRLEPAGPGGPGPDGPGPAGATVIAADGYRVRQRCGLDRDEAASELASAAAELDPSGQAWLIAGPGLAAEWRLPAPYEKRAVRVPEGRPCTGLFAALAEHRRTRRGPVLLTEYDSETGDLSVCALDATTELS